MTSEPDLSRWRALSTVVRAPEGEVRIAVVGKYTNLLDSYKSLNEALSPWRHRQSGEGAARLDWIEPDVRGADTRPAAGRRARHPGAGRLRRARHRRARSRRCAFAREHKIPFFGICFGMQMAVIECARNLAGMPDASSTEFGPCGRSGGRAADRMGARQRAAAAQRGRRSRRHHAGRRVRCDAGAGFTLVRGRYGGTTEISRAPPASLRGQHPLPRAAGAGGPGVLGSVAGRGACRRSSNIRTIPGSSACSITRSCCRSRSRRIRYSPASSQRR